MLITKLYMVFFNFFLNDPFVFFDIYTFNNNIGIFLILSNLLFFYGVYGITINRQNFLLTMLFIEVIYVGIFVHFLVSSLILNSTLGQIYAILLLIIVACESAIGLGILIVLYNKEQSINFIDFIELRG